MSAVLTRETKINLRAQVMQRELIDHAAALAGKTRTAFILEASCAKAEQVLADQTKFVVSDQTLARFNELLDAPLPNAQAIARLLAKQSPWEL